MGKTETDVYRYALTTKEDMKQPIRQTCVPLDQVTTEFLMQFTTNVHNGDRLHQDISFDVRPDITYQTYYSSTFPRIFKTITGLQ